MNPASSKVIIPQLPPNNNSEGFMASLVGLRPIWHTLKNTRIRSTNLPQYSKTFTTYASNQVPSEGLTKARDDLLKKMEEHDAYEASGSPAPDGMLEETDFKALEDLLEQDDGKREREKIPMAPDSQNTVVEYPEDSNVLGARLPRAVQALYLRPLRRQAKYGVPCCDLQLRSYHVRSLEFFADFALRAAYYLRLPAYGPVPLPRMTQRWTVPKSHFIFKKSQENFERTTLRRLIQIKDGHPETVELWLAFLRKHQHHGVGMKASVWEYESLNVGNAMDIKLDSMTKEMKAPWADFGQRADTPTARKVMELMNSAKYRQTAGHVVE